MTSFAAIDFYLHSQRRIFDQMKTYIVIKVGLKKVLGPNRDRTPKMLQL